MIFWLLSILALLIVLAIFWGTMRRAQQLSPEDSPTRVYRAQLEEIAEDLERGLISEEEAKRLRAEIGRKILAAEKTDTQPAQTTVSGYRRPLFFGLAIALPCIAALTYFQIGAPGYPDLPLVARLQSLEDARVTRPSQDSAEAQAAEMRRIAPIDPEAEALLEQLREVLQSRPDDVRGLRLLVRSEAAAGNLVASKAAQARIIDVLSPDVAVEDMATLAELMVLAAGGYVSPEAEMTFREVLAQDAQNGTARYYLGLMYAQGGRADRAFAIWRALLADSAPDDPWLAPIYAQIEEVSLLAGIPTPISELPKPRLRGPSSADIAAAQDMSPEDRQMMIEGMVAQLADRLANAGGPPAEWAQLMSALMVLGERARAVEIYAEAQTVFADTPEALELLQRAAAQAGLSLQ